MVSEYAALFYVRERNGKVMTKKLCSVTVTCSKLGRNPRYTPIAQFPVIRTTVTEKLEEKQGTFYWYFLFYK